MRWLLVLVMLVSCAAPESRQSQGEALPEAALPPVGVSAVQDTPFTMADGVVAALRDADLAALAGVVHPELGLRLAPGGELAPDDPLVSAAEVANLFEVEHTLAGLSPREYWAAFIYPHDFLAAEQVTYSQPWLDREWQGELAPYAEALVVEYSLRDEGKRHSLQLAFLPHAGAWYLSALVYR